MVFSDLHEVVILESSYVPATLNDADLLEIVVCDES